MRVVFFEREILEHKIVDGGDVRIQSHHRSLARFAAKLFLRLFEVIGVQVQIPKGMHKLARLQSGDLCDH